MNERSDDAASSPGRSRRSALGRAFDRLLLGAVAEAPRPQTPAPALGSSGAEAGEANSAGEASAILRRVLPDIYFINTPADRSERHLELLGRLSSAHNAPLLEFHEAQGSPLTECTLCAFDEAVPGLLAKLCGTMAALDLSVHTAFIYTLRLASPQPGAAPNGAQAAKSPLVLASASEVGAGRAVALNTFLMSESYFGHDRALTPKTQRKLKSELCRVLRDQAGVRKLRAGGRRPFAPLQIHELQIENRAHEAQTRILLRAGDSFGVLYRATSALAALGLDIAAAQVSTREEAADDLFFVTQNGAKLPDEALAATDASLRALLQSEP